MAQFLILSQSVDSHSGASWRLTGDWVLEHLAPIAEEIKHIKSHNVTALSADIQKFDTAGALLLTDLLEQLRQAPQSVQGLQPWQLDLLQLVAGKAAGKPVLQQPDDPFTRFFTFVGRKVLAAWQGNIDLLTFLGETVVTLLRVITQPKRLRFSSIVRHIHETGIAAIPIVALIAFLISVVLAYQGANQLQRFGAEIFTINLVAVSVLREMGVLLTAIMIAGRSGSAFTAEIGVMKVNEEIDAMRIIGVSPFEMLVIPRLIALVITLPLLTFIADIMGLIGGGIISETLLNIGFEPYLDRFRLAVKMNDFWVGLIKAPVFAFFIAMVGCMRGMQVTGSAESVGRLTTVSVVQSIFLVLLLDAVFSILFTKLGI